MPARILVIEDDPFKLERIVECVQRGGTDATITTVMSVRAAVTVVVDQLFDVIILDMALPSHDLVVGGASPSSLLSGGLELIMELSFLGRQDRVVIITQYPEIEIEGELVPVSRAQQVLAQLCSCNLRGVIHYRHEAREWERALLAALE